MNFNDFVKFFGSVQKVALILFLSGFFLILSNDEIREVMFLKDFISTYGVYIGFVIIVSGIILLIFIIERSISYFKNKYVLSKNTAELKKVLKDLSLDEKQVLAHFLKNKTQTSNLGRFSIELNEPKPIGMLMAKGFLHKGNVGIKPYYQVDNLIWGILQEYLEEILYEDIFWENSNV